MSSPFKNNEEMYSALEKHVFTLVRVVKKFIHYILQSKVYVIVPDRADKSLLMQSEVEVSG